ncbi:protein of unknown function [Frankineae bacterium MT45]|nr:protein of unknown function [Frankineae bacterium MT45]
MPFTLSHPLAAIGLRATGLPLAAMVAGSMAPDLPLFLPGSTYYPFTHAFAGVVTADLFASVVMVILWVTLLRDALVDTAPAFVRQRLPATAPYSRRDWLLVPVAAIVGSLSHVVWDDFTHQGRWGVQHVGWLQEAHLGMPGYAWAQDVSSVVGLGLSVAFVVVDILRRPRQPRTAQVRNATRPALMALLLISILAAAAGAFLRLPRGLLAAAINATILGTNALAGALIVVAVSWRVLRRRSPDTMARQPTL